MISAFFGLAGALTRVAILDAVRDCVADEVNQRIGDVLNNIVVEFGVRAFEGQLDRLASGFGGVAHRARKAGIEISDRHHARGGDFVLQVVSELGEFVDVRIHAAHEAFELGQDNVHVRGNFSERARENVEVVVAIHFQLAEFEQIVGRDGAASR